MIHCKQLGQVTVRVLRRGAPFVLCAVLCACAGAPVQEMSDARQAYTAAAQAHAEKNSPTDMARARKYLDAAEAALDAGDYSTARDDANVAREAAFRALGMSQQQDISTRPPG